MTDALSAWWAPTYCGGRLEELERQECEALLVAKNIGRLGYRVGDSQRIVPMNYVVTDHYVVFRTAPHSEAAGCIGHEISFEVDDFDEFLLAGWNVLAHGIAEDLPADSLRAMDLGETPEPWAEGVRSVYVRLSLDHLAGRRVHPT